MTVVHTVREWRPAPALARHVTCVWAQTVSRDSEAFMHRTSPTGSVELVCAVGSRPRIVGPQTGPIAQKLAPGTTIVGLRLRPEAAASVLGWPACELVDLTIEADEGDALGELVAGAGSPEEAAAHLQRAVGERVAASPDPVVAEAVRRLTHGQRSGVAAMASSLFISER